MLEIIKGLVTPKQKIWSPTEGRGQILSPEGDVLWEDPDWISNALVDEGEESVLNVWLRAQANPQKYLMCINQAAPAETDTMAGLTESKTPGQHGYDRQEITSAEWAAPSLNSGDMQSAAAEKTFGPITTAAMTVSHVCLVTSATGTGGKFLLYLALSATSTIAVGQSFKYTLRAKAQ